MKTKSESPLRAVRKSRTMSQADLARLAGLAQQTVAAYENGRIAPPFHVQARLAAILGVPSRELFPDQQQVAS